ncbi:hypothetical protein B0H10DRAFT_1967813 [Mycena sp. CBHHK59/15]|nr:hypothetical protein B0H10DRAFT_1967813 [Mycena sp. CBHHK59/15]
MDNTLEAADAPPATKKCAKPWCKILLDINDSKHCEKCRLLDRTNQRASRQIVMCLAWLEARKPRSQSPGFLIPSENFVLEARAWAKARPSQAPPYGFGFGFRSMEPKPGEAKPKPGFQSQAKPEHHYRQKKKAKATASMNTNSTSRKRRASTSSADGRHRTRHRTDQPSDHRDDNQDSEPETEDGIPRLEEDNNNEAVETYSDAESFFDALRADFKSGKAVDFHGRYTLAVDPLVSPKERVQMVATEIWQISGYRCTSHLRRICQELWEGSLMEYVMRGSVWKWKSVAITFVTSNPMTPADHSSLEHSKLPYISPHVHVYPPDAKLEKESAPGIAEVARSSTSISSASLSSAELSPSESTSPWSPTYEPGPSGDVASGISTSSGSSGGFVVPVVPGAPASNSACRIESEIVVPTVYFS